MNIAAARPRQYRQARRADLTRPRRDRMGGGAVTPTQRPQYKAIGPLTLRALEQEDVLPLLHRNLEEGRRMHRAWLENVFGPYLVRLRTAERERRIKALYAP